MWNSWKSQNLVIHNACYWKGILDLTYDSCGNRVLIDRLLCKQNYPLLLSAISSSSSELKAKYINALLVAAKFEGNHHILSEKQIIRSLISGLISGTNDPNEEKNSLHILYLLLSVDGMILLQ